MFSVSLIHHDAKAPTCTEIGWDAYDTCSRCDYTTYVEKEALGHDWGAATYSWNDENTEVTATHVCSRNSEHMETEQAPITSMITKQATCTEQGQTTYMAVFENTSFTKQTKTETNIPATGHRWSNSIYTWDSNNLIVTALHYCLNNPRHSEEEVSAVVSEVTKPATCTEQGQTTYSANFKNDNFDQQKKTLTDIPATEHTWGKPIYIWAPDNSIVTAKRICNADTTHTEDETVRTNSMIDPPTKTKSGSYIYETYSFRNAGFQIQKKSGVIPALNQMETINLPSSLKEIAPEALANLACEAVIFPEGSKRLKAAPF